VTDFTNDFFPLPRSDDISGYNRWSQVVLDSGPEDWLLAINAAPKRNEKTASMHDSFLLPSEYVAVMSFSFFNGPATIKWLMESILWGGQNVNVGNKSFN
jgi:hypothetical protein